MRKSLLNTLLIIFSSLIISCGEDNSENSGGGPGSATVGAPSKPTPRRATGSKVVTLKATEISFYPVPINNTPQTLIEGDLLDESKKVPLNYFNTIKINGRRMAGAASEIDGKLVKWGYQDLIILYVFNREMSDTELQSFEDTASLIVRQAPHEMRLDWEEYDTNNVEIFCENGEVDAYCLFLYKIHVPLNTQEGRDITPVFSIRHKTIPNKVGDKSFNSFILNIR